MKKTFIFLTICVLTLSATAQTPLVASNTQNNSEQISKSSPALAPEQLTLKETEYDFGKIPQGKPVNHIFEVVNNGGDSLRIVNVQASCGCTTPEWDREKIQAPGEKTNITVGYNAASEGQFTKQITITYNGTQTRQITIKGDVWKTPATSVPENKALGNLKD